MLKFGLNIFYFIYMKRDWAEHRCYVKALSQIKFTQIVSASDLYTVHNSWKSGTIFPQY